IDRQRLEIRQADFGEQVAAQRREAALGQAALQRHLAAFETDLVKTARAGLLALMATAGGLAQTGTDATAHAAAGTLGAFGGGERVQLSDGHLNSFRLPRR